MIPGQTFMTWMPSWDSSRRSESLIACKANFDEQYMTAQGSDTNPPTDPILTIEPLPCLRKCGITNWARANGAKTFSSYSLRARSRSTIEGGAYNPTPALLMSASTRPKRSSVRSTTEERTRPSVKSPGVTRQRSPALSSKPGSGNAESDNSAPFFCSSRATASPRPWDAPVTMTTLSLRFISISLSSAAKFKKRLWPVRG
jgi:hypothetical protein